MDYDKLSKEELIALMAMKSVPVKTKRKKEMEEDKRQEMLDRLQKMRETVATNRLAKKECGAPTETASKPVITTASAFERTYSTKLDKLTAIVTTLSEQQAAAANAKVQKKAAAQAIVDAKAAAQVQAQAYAAHLQAQAQANATVAAAQKAVDDHQAQQLQLARARPAPPTPGPTASPFRRPKPQMW